MRYLLLSSTWPAPPVNAELVATGELVDAARLADPALSGTVRKAAGAVVCTDGPAASAPTGGYWLLDCASYDRALAIAARVLDGADGVGTVEVRPVLDRESSDWTQ